MTVHPLPWLDFFSLLLQLFMGGLVVTFFLFILKNAGR